MNDDQRCKTCKWWGWDNDPHGEKWPFSSAPGAAPDGWQSCGLVKRETYAHEPQHGALMLVDGYEWDGLYTAPDFGCVQWAPMGEDT